MPPSQGQGCQMVHFQTKNPNLGKLWRALTWKRLIYFMAILNIILSNCKFYFHFDIYVLEVWNIFPRFGIFGQ
jgi:hypothetical protein